MSGFEIPIGITNMQGSRTCVRTRHNERIWGRNHGEVPSGRKRASALATNVRNKSPPTNLRTRTVNRPVKGPKAFHAIPERHCGARDGQFRSRAKLPIPCSAMPLRYCVEGLWTLHWAVNSPCPQVGWGRLVSHIRGKRAGALAARGDFSMVPSPDSFVMTSPYACS